MPTHRGKGGVSSVGSGSASGSRGGWGTTKTTTATYGSASRGPQWGESQRFVGQGLQIALRSIPGFTDPDALRSPFYFQCPPSDDFTRDYQFQWTDYNTVGYGQFTRPAGRQLATITFQTLFVDWPAIFTVARVGTRAPHPQELDQRLHGLLNSGTPFEFIAGQQRLWGKNDVHWAPVYGNAATLRDFQIAERAGELDARYVSVQFAEFRDPELLKRARGKHAASEHSKSRKKAKTGHRDSSRGRSYPRTVRYAHGQMREISTGKLLGGPTVTLSSLARDFYGQPSLWKLIAKANKIDYPANAPLATYVAKRKESTLTLTIPEPPDRKE